MAVDLGCDALAAQISLMSYLGGNQFANGLDVFLLPNLDPHGCPFRIALCIA